jgi:hypothetical protein
METWALILMVILIIAIGSMIAVVYISEKKNTLANQKNILYPFTGTYDSTSGTVSLQNAQNLSQIDCSTVSGKNGGKINIVGAFFDVDDPYGTCTGSAASVVDLSCGIPGGKISCTSQADCGGGMQCAGGFCSPATAKLVAGTGNIDTTNSECTSAGGSYCPVQPGTSCKNGQSDCNDSGAEVMTCDPSTKTCQVNPDKSCYGVNTQYNTCAIFPLCSNATLSTTVVNNTCSPSSSCMSRDASAYLAGKCDGKETCAPIFSAVDPNGGLGPMPCSSRNTLGLPIIPGQGGNYSQGYSFHGVYTCIPQ